MGFIRFIKNRFTDQQYTTEVRVLKPDMSSHSTKISDYLAFDDLRCPKQFMKQIPAKKSKSAPTLSSYKISPFKDMAANKPIYSAEELDRIAEMFIVTYTHCTSEEELPQYGKRNERKSRKTGIKCFFKRSNKIISLNK
ncbi:hypothetical protein ACF0H5_001254 [Mactra antiquata]